MGLSSFPSAAEGVLPVLVMNTVLSVALLKNMLRSVLQIVGAAASGTSSPNFEENPDNVYLENARERTISTTQFKFLCQNMSRGTNVEHCCVCLSGFEADEEVSELSCKHFFHKGCLEKWFCNKHSTTCPLCRSRN